MRSLSQSSISDSTHPTRDGPSCTRLGNFPAISSLAMCAGEYRTISRTCLFDNMRIAIAPSWETLQRLRLAKAGRVYNFLSFLSHREKAFCISEKNVWR